MSASASVLVAYATAHGSTTGVAERIAAGLERACNRVALLPVDRVERLAGYDAVVLGSPVYNQSWLPDAEAFVRDNRADLAARPLWVFSVGTFGDTRRVIGPLMKREPKDVGQLRESTHARGYRVFAGVIDRHQWPFLSRLFFWSLGGRLGDNRDWPEIDAWAAEIAQALPALRAAVPQ